MWSAIEARLCADICKWQMHILTHERSAQTRSRSWTGPKRLATLASTKPSTSASRPVSHLKAVTHSDSRTFCRGSLRSRAEEPLPDCPGRRGSFPGAVEGAGPSTDNVSVPVLRLQTVLTATCLTKQQTAPLKMAAPAHTLRMNTGHLETVLADLCGNVLCCSCLKMDPDIDATNNEETASRYCFNVHACLVSMCPAGLQHI